MIQKNSDKQPTITTAKEFREISSPILSPCMACWHSVHGTTFSSFVDKVHLFIPSIEYANDHQKQCIYDYIHCILDTHHKGCLYL